MWGTSYARPLIVTVIVGSEEAQVVASKTKRKKKDEVIRPLSPFAADIIIVRVGGWSSLFMWQQSGHH